MRGSSHKKYGNYHKKYGNYHNKSGSYHNKCGSYHKKHGNYHKNYGNYHIFPPKQETFTCQPVYTTPFDSLFILHTLLFALCPLNFTPLFLPDASLLQPTPGKRG